MKNLITLLIAVALIATSCKKDDNEAQTEKERVSALLASGQWKIKTLMIDNVASSSYAGLTITFTGTSYTSTNGSPAWPSGGTWSFTDETAKSFKRSDNTLITINSISESSLVLAYDWSENILNPGRVSSVTGKHVLTLQK